MTRPRCKPWVAGPAAGEHLSTEMGAGGGGSVGSTLDAPLTRTSVRLAECRANQRLVELGFAIRSIGLDVAQLRRMTRRTAAGCGAKNSSKPWKRSIPSDRRLHDGLIDLVFEAQGRYYIVDYKSNWLGARTSQVTRHRNSGRRWPHPLLPAIT